MDIALFFIGCIACLCIVVASIVILHPRIHEGVLIKAGLITLAVGAFAMVNHVAALSGHVDVVDQVRPLVRSVAACSGGVVLVLIGLAWRIWRHPELHEAAQAVSGWAPLDG